MSERCSECGRKAKLEGLCGTHHNARHRFRAPKHCSFEGCEREHYALTFCRLHYKRFHAGSDLAPPIRQMGVGSRNNGYRELYRPNHPNANANGMVLEHRLVMSEMLRRPLRTGENVHHINGDKTDNRPENLELWSTQQPSGQRIEEKLSWARDLLALYSSHDCERVLQCEIDAASGW